jgi:HD-GYP domain-containing protein (c-di-GMP phosphodiesterase class II)
MKNEIILLETNIAIRNSIDFLLSSKYNFEVTYADTVEETIIHINNSKSIQMIIICDDCPGDEYEVFKKLQETASKIPLVILSEKKPKIYPTHHGKKPSSVISKKTCLKNLEEIASESFTVDENFEKEEFTSVKFDSLEFFDALDDDMYIRLLSGRHIKLFSKGDEVTHEDVEKYSRKHIKKLSINKDTYVWILNVLKDRNVSMAETPEKPVSIKKIREKQKESVREDLSEIHKDNKAVMDDVHYKSAKVLKNIKKNKDLAGFLKKVKIDREDSKWFKNRMSLICNIGCGISKELGWDSDASFEKIIYIANLHDLILMSSKRMAEVLELGEHDKPDLTDKEKEIIINHPQIAADIINDDPRSPKEAANIILQHHEYNTDGSFPGKISHTRVMPFSAIFMVSVHFAQYILDNPKWKFEDYLIDTQGKFNSGYFKKAWRALEAMSKKKKRVR